MTKSEYIKLLNESVSFSKLDEASKEMFRDAQGVKMRHYARIFQEEAEIVDRAYRKLQDDTKQILADFDRQASHDNSVRTSKAEVAEHRKEMSEAEAILKNI